MNRKRRSSTGLAILAILLCLGNAQGAEFHLVHGMRGEGDFGNLLAETPSGHLLVAGSTRRDYPDMGEGKSAPYFAAFDRDGSVVWEQVYDGKDHGQVLGIHASGTSTVILLASGRGRSRVSLLELWKLNALGNLQQRLAYTVVDDGYARAWYTEGGMLIWIGGNNDSDTLYELSWEGRLSPIRIWDTETVGRPVASNGQALLNLRRHDDRTGFDLVVADWTGRVVAEAKIPNCDRRCGRIFATISDDRGFFIALGHDRESDLDRVELLLIDPDTAGILSRAELSSLAGAEVSALELAADGELLLAGSAQGQALVAKVSPLGDPSWIRRFSSLNDTGRARAIIELSDRRIAMTGSTGPQGLHFSSPDSDILVQVTDSDLSLLDKFSRCSADQADLSSLLETLSNVARIALLHQDLVDLRRSLNDGGTRSQVSLPTALAAPNECVHFSEPDLLTFLRTVTIGLENAYVRPDARIRIRLTTPKERDNQSFAYRLSRSHIGDVPAMSVDLYQAAAVAEELRVNVVPHLAEIHQIWESLAEESNFGFANGNRFGQRARNYEPALSPAEMLDIARNLKRNFEGMNQASQQNIRIASKHRRRHIGRIVVDPDAEETHRDRLGRVVVPPNQAEAVWRWILEENEP